MTRMMIPCDRNHDFLYTGTVISLVRTGDVFTPGIFSWLLTLLIGFVYIFVFEPNRAPDRARCPASYL